MEQEGLKSQEFLFTPRQLLGMPVVIPPPKPGHVQAAVQFVIPGLAVGKKDHAALQRLCERVGRAVHAVDIKRGAATETKQPATLVAMGFYVPQSSTDEAITKSVDNRAIEIVERFLGMLSFLAGTRLVAAHTQTTVVKEAGSMATKLEPLGRAESKIRLELPENPFRGRTPTDNIFIALFWLRRALAERDPLDNYAALMVSLQAVARELVGSKPVERRCSKRGHLIAKEPTVTAMVRELVVKKLGASPGLFDQLWKARNAIIAHGNQPVNADTFLRLTELKFEAADLCYKGVKMAMGLPLDGPPILDPSYFVTSALMYVE